MSPYPISNAHTPFKGIDGSLVNMDNSHVGGIPFANTKIPYGPHTLSPAGSNIQGAAGIYPCFNGQCGGKINRKKINKISRKYKMKGSKRTIKRRIRRIKNRVRRSVRRSHRGRSRSRGRGRNRSMNGGAFQPALTAPNYPGGYTQYQNNNGSISNTYSTGGVLGAGSSALANPVPYQKVDGDVDNLNHNTLNAYGNIGAGSGFASRGWF